MQACIEETERRRTKQLAYNLEHNITPETVRKSMRTILDSLDQKDYLTPTLDSLPEEIGDPKKVAKEIKRLHKQMLAAAKELDFEKAAALRDQIRALEEAMVSIG
jgi:excinuclease ABC subunit B